MTGTGKAQAVLWLVIMPALGLGLYFGVFAPNYHPAARGAPQPFSCQSEVASLSVLGSSGQIAPLCGAAAYPAVTP